MEELIGTVKCVKLLGSRLDAVVDRMSGKSGGALNMRPCKVLMRETVA